MNIQFKKGVIELCVFSILSKKDHTAYELVKIISSSVKVPVGNLYPLLRHLTYEGLLETTMKEINGDSKKTYRLTKKGFEAKEIYLLEWQDIIYRVSNLIEED
ncbi:MAG: PadR family transcriptional regulator [Firmicutes bacterium HGW-Firmicutes-7]|nr:MAG: PadR family transcriptional regulator [Firmicutes bacterium HGW-Firmicutes-7]